MSLWCLFEWVFPGILIVEKGLFDAEIYTRYWNCRGFILRQLGVLRSVICSSVACQFTMVSLLLRKIKKRKNGKNEIKGEPWMTVTFFILWDNNIRRVYSLAYHWQSVSWKQIDLSLQRGHHRNIGIHSRHENQISISLNW